MGMGGERGKLASTIWKCLKQAEERQIPSLALSPISVGEFGYPVEGCADVMAQRCVDFTFEDVQYLKTIVLHLPNQGMYEVFKRAFEREIKQAQEESRPDSP
jgi:O-acetyl-ADP-ribose deacetylase (regulator of RNase III)